MILSSFSLVTHKMALPFNIPFNLTVAKLMQNLYGAICLRKWK